MSESYWKMRVRELEDENKNLWVKNNNLLIVIKSKDEIIKRQGKEAERRHNFLCSVKEEVDGIFVNN